MLRLFVALTLPADIRERVCGLMGGVPGARWVPAENLHLTLRFIGDVDEGAADDLDAALARTQFAPFMLTLEGVGVFGASRRPRALWVGVSPSAELDILQGRVEAAALRAGQPAESPTDLTQWQPVLAGDPQSRRAFTPRDYCAARAEAPIRPTPPPP